MFCLFSADVVIMTLKTWRSLFSGTISFNLSLSFPINFNFVCYKPQDISNHFIHLLENILLFVKKLVKNQKRIIVSLTKNYVQYISPPVFKYIYTYMIYIYIYIQSVSGRNKCSIAVRTYYVVDMCDCVWSIVLLPCMMGPHSCSSHKQSWLLVIPNTE